MKPENFHLNCLRLGALLISLLPALQHGLQAESRKPDSNSAAHYANELWGSLSPEQRTKVTRGPMSFGSARGLQLSETDNAQQALVFKLLTATAQPGPQKVPGRQWSAVNNLVYHYRRAVESSNLVSEGFWISGMGRYGDNPPLHLRLQTPDLFLTIHLDSHINSTVPIPLGTNGTTSGTRRLEKRIAELAASLDSAQRKEALILAPHKFVPGTSTSLRPPFPDIGITASQLTSGKQQELLQHLLQEYCYWQGKEFVDREWETVSKASAEALRLAWVEDLELPNRATFLMKAADFHLRMSCTLPK